MQLRLKGTRVPEYLDLLTSVSYLSWFMTAASPPFISASENGSILAESPLKKYEREGWNRTSSPVQLRRPGQLSSAHRDPGYKRVVGDPRCSLSSLSRRPPAVSSSACLLPPVTSPSSSSAPDGVVFRMEMPSVKVM